MTLKSAARLTLLAILVACAFLAPAVPLALAAVLIAVTVYTLSTALAGHWRGIAIERVSIGWLLPFTWQRGSTQLQLGLLPFGGSVKFAGDHNAMRSGVSSEYMSRHPIERMLIHVTGPVATLATALLVLCAAWLLPGPTPWLVRDASHVGTHRLSGPYRFGPASQPDPFRTWWTGACSIEHSWFEVETFRQPLRDYAGPIGILACVGRSSTGGPKAFAHSTALLLLLFGLANLLPIPPFAGGHVALIFVELMRGRPLSQGTLNAVLIVSLLALLFLVIAVTWFDVCALL